jgi:DNA-binding MarR family transcriptional regulator
MSSTKRQLLEQLYRTTFELGRLMRQRMIENADECVNPIQVHALLLIEHMTSPSATALVNRLTRQSLVARRHDRLNRKLVRLTLTPAGRRMIQHMDELHAKIVNDMFGHLDEQQLKSLITLHHAMLSGAPSTSTSL